MSLLFDQSGRTLKCLFLALIVLFAQQAAQLHALAHAQDQLAQPLKGKPASHPIEQCVAFHAIDSALVATAALQDFDFAQAERTPWSHTEAQAFSVYRLPARAPPQVV
jgi:hypothetical protein